mgnify:FL=1
MRMASTLNLIVAIAVLLRSVKCGELNMENGFWSDYLTLEVSKSSYVPSQDSIFTRVKHPTGTPICELTGQLVPADSLNYLTVAPLIIAPNKSLYHVVGSEDSLCFKVNDCIDPTSIDFTPFPGCEYNAKFSYSNTGKLFIYPIRDILPGEEIFVFYGGAHWELRRSNFGSESNYYSTHPSLNYPLPVGSIDSDYLQTFIGPSLLGVGSGLFARFDIPVGEIICEYQGPTYKYGEHPTSDKLSHLYTVDGVHYVSVGVAPCSISNDAAHIFGRSYTVAEYIEIYDSPRYDSIPMLPGFSQNSAKIGEVNHKCFVIAVKEIPAGAEILYSFGK